MSLLILPKELFSLIWSLLKPTQYDKAILSCVSKSFNTLVLSLEIENTSMSFFRWTLKGGYLSLLKLINIQAHSEFRHVWCFAGFEGHLNIIEYLFDTFGMPCEFDQMLFCVNLINQEHPKILEWAYKNGFKLK